MGEAGPDEVGVCSGRTWSLANPEPVSECPGPSQQRAGSGMCCSLLPRTPLAGQPWGGVAVTPQQPSYCRSVFYAPAHATPAEVLPFPKAWDLGRRLLVAQPYLAFLSSWSTSCRAPEGMGRSRVDGRGISLRHSLEHYNMLCNMQGPVGLSVA